MYNTYSFSDVSAVIIHPSFGQYIATGAGLGSITTDMTTDRTIHDIAADGNVMVTKVRARNGTISIAIQQTSSLHQWLTKLYNYLESASTDQWAGIIVSIRTPAMAELETCTGVSFTKLPSSPRQQQGQNLTWSLIAADIQRNPA
ncbi:DUF3277 family protein [Desulfosporosinus sp. PR]|uniref:phage protein n=1 Tax=Candidatus Desulfosporosinus nitrosoreducens TaxID=3401928 RepID=UPI0027ED6F3F|nr:phage protein [Desulfosporosinus sp. PR]MDQ7094214.1 DUF3277 family protein [Desulfosporosinus sp. PR]